MSTDNLPADLAAFAARLRGHALCRFAAGQPLLLTRAPGRLDALGGVIDYTGGTVCEMPCAVATRVALQPRADRVVRIVSLGVEEHGLTPVVEVPLDALLSNDYAAVGSMLRADPSASWAAYVAGAWTVLFGEGLVPSFPSGAEVVIDSDVPAGAGVSSSAAIEMATLLAVARYAGADVEPSRLAHLGQRVENRVVGAPCGLMDQLTVTLGLADSLLVIRCQPDQIVANRRLPQGVTLGAIHTGVKHSVGGRHYTDARVSAFMAHRIILDHLRALGTVGAADDPFGGYLAEVRPSEFATAYLPLLPERMTGAAFIAAHGQTVDTATRVDPDTTYRVASAARHHVRENANTYAFLEALDAFERTQQTAFLELAGELMIQGHDGYRDDLDLGAPEADLLVALAMSEGPLNGVYGGRITGGGSGGSVIFLGDDRLPALLPRLAERYATESGCQPTILLGSSDGAAAVGVNSLVW